MKRSDKVLFGLLGALALLVLLCAACVAAVVLLPTHWWTSGGAVQASREFLASNAVVQEKVGKIRRFGWIPSGSIQETNGAGKAHLILGLEGEKGEAKATLDLVKDRGGAWKVKAASLFKDGQEFVLEGKPDPTPSPEQPLPQDRQLPPSGAPEGGGQDGLPA